MVKKPSAPLTAELSSSRSSSCSRISSRARSSAAGEPGRAQNSERSRDALTCTPERMTPTSSSAVTSSGAIARRRSSSAASSGDSAAASSASRSGAGSPGARSSGEQRQHAVPVAGLVVELLLPVGGRRGLDQRREPLGDGRDAGAVGRRDLEHAEERPGGAAHGVVGRAGRDDAAAVRARLEAERAGGVAAGGEHAGADLRLGQQAREHLALGDDVGVGDDERPAGAGGDAGDRAQVVGGALTGVHLHVGRGGDRLAPGRAREHVDALDAEAGELAGEAGEQRLALPRLQRGGAAVRGRGGRHQHGRGSRADRNRPPDGRAGTRPSLR